MSDRDHQVSQCSNCGGAAHIYSWLCPMDLHGEEDWAKTSCANCGDEIPSGGPREADSRGNLFCTLECKSEGQETLIERISNIRSETEASADA